MTELITNGSFDTDASGWSALNVTLSVVSGRLRVTNTGSGSGIAHQAIATEVGKGYVVRSDAFLGTSTNVRVSAATAAGNTAIAYSGAGVGKAFTFTATTTTTYIRCQTMTTTAGLYDDFDNISVQALPPRGPVRSSFVVT